MTIPCIIHHIWMGTNPIPATNILCANSVKEHHANFEYKLWKDQDVDTLMRTEFPEYYEKFNELPRLIMKIDIFRYFLMYKYGGLYTDMDYFMFKPFDLLQYNVVIPCNRETDSGEPECLGNCIFASKPNHPFWKSLMNSLFTIDRRKLDYTNDKNIDGSLMGTGPVFVYGMWKNYAKSNSDIYIPKRKLFHPITKINNDYINGLKTQGCYGIHYCTGLWRNQQL